MNKRIPTSAEFEAASSICFAVQQQFVEKARTYNSLAKEAVGQEKGRLQELEEQAYKRSLFYLKQRFRAGEGAYCPNNENPSKESMDAYEKAITCYVRSLSLTQPSPPQP